MTRLGKTGSFAIGVMHPLIYNHAVRYYLGMDVVQFSFNTRPGIPNTFAKLQK